MKIDRPQNKTEYVCDQLKREIRSGTMKPGTRLASMRELCSRFDVSIAVINSAYNQLEQQGLIERRVGNGTYIALPPEKLGRVFGVLTSIQSRFMDGYYHAVFDAASQSGDTVILQYLEQGKCFNAAVDRLLAQKPDAILIDLEVNGFDHAALLSRLGNIPICYVNRYEWDDPLQTRAVLVDYSGMIAMALHKLSAAGHRRFLYLCHENEPWPFERQLLCRAAADSHMAFNSKQFGCVSQNDFRCNRERLEDYFSGADYPTVLICRGDSTLYNFMVKLRLLYPHIGELEAVGCFDTVWSNLPGCEFRSFTVDFTLLWQKAFAAVASPEVSVENYLPDWPELKTQEQEMEL